MRILLDTHVWLWMVTASDRLGPRTRELLEDVGNTLFLSAASVWEMAIKYRLGRLPLPEPPALFVPPRLLRDGVLALPVDVHHAAALADLPQHHADPFDRVLVAQARIEGLHLLTVSDAMGAYEIERLSARD